MAGAHGGPDLGPWPRAPEQNLGPGLWAPVGPRPPPPVVGLCPGHDPGSLCVTFSVTFLRHNFLNFRSSCNARSNLHEVVQGRGPSRPTLPKPGRNEPCALQRALPSRPPTPHPKCNERTRRKYRACALCQCFCNAVLERSATHSDLSSLSHENIFSSSSRAEAATAFRLE